MRVSAGTDCKYCTVFVKNQKDKFDSFALSSEKSFSPGAESEKSYYTNYLINKLNVALFANCIQIIMYYIYISSFTLPL